MQHYLTVRAGVQGVILLGGGALAGGILYKTNKVDPNWGALSGLISGLAVFIFTNHPKINKNAWVFNLGSIVVKDIVCPKDSKVSDAESPLLVIQFITGLMVSQLNPGA